MKGMKGIKAEIKRERSSSAFSTVASEAGTAGFRQVVFFHPLHPLHPC
jgi:hypothetical protein